MGNLKGFPPKSCLSKADVNPIAIHNSQRLRRTTKRSSIGNSMAAENRSTAATRCSYNNQWCNIRCSNQWWRWSWQHRWWNSQQCNSQKCNNRWCSSQLCSSRWCSNRWCNKRGLMTMDPVPCDREGRRLDVFIKSVLMSIINQNLCSPPKFTIMCLIGHDLAMQQHLCCQSYLIG